jgi:hypothetical protein
MSLFIDVFWRKAKKQFILCLNKEIKISSDFFLFKVEIKSKSKRKLLQNIHFLMNVMFLFNLQQKLTLFNYVNLQLNIPYSLKWLINSFHHLNKYININKKKTRWIFCFEIFYIYFLFYSIHKYLKSFKHRLSMDIREIVKLRFSSLKLKYDISSIENYFNNHVNNLEVLTI